MEELSLRGHIYKTTLVPKKLRETFGVEELENLEKPEIQRVLCKDVFLRNVRGCTYGITNMTT